MTTEDHVFSVDSLHEEGGSRYQAVCITCDWTGRWVHADEFDGGWVDAKAMEAAEDEGAGHIDDRATVISMILRRTDGEVQGVVHTTDSDDGVRG